MSEERKELFSQKVAAGSRTYFFDVKQTKDGMHYLVITESRRKDDSYEHEKVMISEENFQACAAALDAAFSFVGVRPSMVPKSSHLMEIRRQFPRAYEKWSAAEDDILRKLFGQGKSVEEIAADLQHQPGAIHSRLAKLGLVA